MKQLFFWSSWSLGYKLPYTIAFCVFLFALAFLGHSAWLGELATTPWYNSTDTEIVPVVIDQFNKNFFDFSLSADAYLLISKFEASIFQLNYLSHYICLGLLTFGMVMILIAMSDLSTYWYIASMTFILFLLASMGLEQNGIFTLINDKKLPLVVMFSLLAPTIFFRTIGKDLSYFVRMLAYLAIVGGLFYFIGTKSRLQYPVVAAVNYGMIMPMVAFALFCYLNGHEIIRGLLFIVSNSGGNPRQNMFKLGFLALIYLFNLVYAMLYANYSIDWDIFRIHPAVFFMFTATIGIWGFKSRETQYEDSFPFAPDGAFLYLGLAIMCLGSFGFSYANNNEALKEVYEDWLFYAHLGVGLGFMGYIFFNFKDMLNTGYKVHRVLFKPIYVLFSISWFFGIMVSAGLMFGNGFYIFEQPFAGYYTGVADSELAEGRQYEAKQYYNLALSYNLANLRINYSLGSLALKENKKDAAYFYFEEAAQRDLPQAFAMMSYLKADEGNYFQSIFDLQKGVKENPLAGQLYNNLALKFNEKNFGDSAFIYFEIARSLLDNPEAVEANMFSLWSKYPSIAQSEGFEEDWKPSENIVTQANEFAFLTRAGKLFDKGLNAQYLKDSIISTEQMCYMYNYALNQLKEPDTALVNRLKATYKVPDNLIFDKYFELAIGSLLFEQGNFTESFQFLKGAKRSGMGGNYYFPHMLGLRYLQMEAYEKAAFEFRDAFEKGNEESLLNWAIASSELSDKTEAIEAWNLIRKAGTKEQKVIATEFLSFIQPEKVQLLNLQDSATNDVTRYRYLHYNQAILSNEGFDVVYQKIQSKPIRVLIATERTQYFVKEKDETNAAIYMAKATGEHVNGENSEVDAAFEMAYLAFVHFQGNLDNDFYQKASDAKYPKHLRGLRNYYLADYQASQGKSEEAEMLYLLALQQLPFYPEVPIEINRFYQRTGQSQKGYDIMVEAVQDEPQSVPLQKAYILCCLEVGYTNYGQYALEDLKALISEEEYNVFEQEYLKRLNEAENNWTGVTE